MGAPAARTAKTAILPGSIGLIATSVVSHSFLARNPVVRARLGPVYAPILRLASRIAGAFRSGTPTTDLASLSRCAMVLICAPDAQLDSLILAAASAEIPWRRKTVVLCDTARDSSSLGPIAKLGAHCASLEAIPASGETRFVAEGDVEAIAEVRRLLGRTVLLVLHHGGKGAYHAGLLLATDLALEWTAGAVDSLRAAGLTRRQAVPIIEALATQGVRSYAKAGRRGAAGLPSVEELNACRDALVRSDPRLAELFDAALSISMIWRRKDDKY